MKPSTKNPLENDSLLPVDIVLGPSWWHRHEGIVFDEDFFYHPARRVEVERRMEKVLFDRWGGHGLGADRDKDLPCVGAVHLAAGYLISEMLGCRVTYADNEPPQVLPADVDSLKISPDAAFASPAFKRLDALFDVLKTKYGYLCGDIGASGVLNVALDLRGQRLFLDMADQPHEVVRFLGDIFEVIRRFTDGIGRQTGTTSISVNRISAHFKEPMVLHCECSHTMISVADYERYLMPFDIQWCQDKRPYGIHYCGTDPHRFAESFAKLPHLDFLDVGWGGDIAKLREYLPHTFFSIRYSPVEIVQHSPDKIRTTLRRLIKESGNPYLTGVCCINMDETVSDAQVGAIFEAAEELREEFAGREG